MGEQIPGSDIARLREALETPEERQFRENMKRDYEYGSPGQIREHILKLVEKIKTISARSKASEEEKKQLAETKLMLFNSLINAIESCREYHNAVIGQVMDARAIGATELDREAREEAMEEKYGSDKRRRIKHNAMMSKLQATSEMARRYFDKKFEPEEIAKPELREKVENMHHERIDLPENIFTPENPQLQLRQEWGDFAEQIYEAFLDEPAAMQTIQKAIEKMKSSK